ncbi:MAG: cysteine--tRNA ligase [Myxococcota bacterium]
MALRIYNTLTRLKEDFIPLETGHVGMYVCGVTVYDYCHIGHARCYVAFDVVRRWLQRTYTVKYVQNFTDVDDKIIARAHETGEEPLALSARFADEFHHDMDDLGIMRADVEPRVSTSMDDIIDFVIDLERKGFAYRVPSTSGVQSAAYDVYFRVKKHEHYTALSGRNLDDMVAGARVGVDERKEDPLDFALWKSAKPGEIWWDSPYGRGRPGWHIECSAMSERHLGDTFDIHGGGKDLVFPHHTNEIAQSECRHDGRVFARHWMHNGFVDFAGEKMSKSLGNFFTIREVTARYHPEALRYLLLTAHYRSPLSFDVVSRCPKCPAELTAAEQQVLHCDSCGAALGREEVRQRVSFPGLEEAEGRLRYLYETARRVDRYLGDNAPAEGPGLEEVFGREGTPFLPWIAFGEALDDDFNTPVALASLAELLKVANALVDAREKELCGRKLKPADRARLLDEWRLRMREMLGVLGLGQRGATAVLDELNERRLRARGIERSVVEELVARRSAAREARDFATADLAREELTRLGVEVRDLPSGVEWVVS